MAEHDPEKPLTMPASPKVFPFRDWRYRYCPEPREFRSNALILVGALGREMSLRVCSE